jgi:hypothetical protein
MTAVRTTEITVVEPGFSDPVRYALAAFLAGYRGLTRDAYALDLRQFVAWCTEHDRRLFDVRRADIECFARDLEARGRARATVARRLCTVAGFYRYAEQEGPLEARRLPMSADPDSTTSPTPPAWTAARSGHSWSLPGWRLPPSTLSSPCSPSTVCGCRRPGVPTSRRSAWSGDIEPSPWCARAGRS